MVLVWCCVRFDGFFQSFVFGSSLVMGCNCRRITGVADLCCYGVGWSSNERLANLPCSPTCFCSCDIRCSDTVASCVSQITRIQYNVERHILDSWCHYRSCSWGFGAFKFEDEQSCRKPRCLIICGCASSCCWVDLYRYIPRGCQKSGLAWFEIVVFHKPERGATFQEYVLCGCLQVRCVHWNRFQLHMQRACDLCNTQHPVNDVLFFCPFFFYFVTIIHTCP